MLFLVTVSAGHLAWVFFELFRVAVPTAAVGDIDGVNSKSWGGAFSSLISVLFATLFFLLLSSLGMSFFQLLRS